MTKHLHRIVLAITATVALIVAGASSALAMTDFAPSDGGSGQQLPKGPVTTTVADTGMAVPWLYVGPAIAVAVIAALVLFLAVRGRHAGATTVQGA